MHAYYKTGWTLKDVLKPLVVPTQRRCAGEILGLSKLLALNTIHHKSQVLIISVIIFCILTSISS